MEECHQILIGHNVRVSFVTYSPRGDQIATGGEGGSLKMWDLEEETCHWTLSGHNDWIARIVYSLQGDLIVSSSWDESVRLWDVASGQCRAVIRGFRERVNDIAWIEDSGVNYLATGCSDGMVGMWKVEVNEDRCDVSLQWGRMRGGLNVVDATIDGVHGLSQLNKQLLLQRGAT
jgi:WD40 repeat protein